MGVLIIRRIWKIGIEVNRMDDYNWWDDRTVEAPDLCPYTMQGCYSGECAKCEVEREFVERMAEEND